MSIIVNMQDPIAARGVRLAALAGVVKMAQIGMKTRGVTPSKAAKMLGYTGPANLAKIAKWIEDEQVMNAADRVVIPPVPFGE
jgi:hypothetical protein